MYRNIRRSPTMVNYRGRSSITNTDLSIRSVILLALLTISAAIYSFPATSGAAAVQSGNNNTTGTSSPNPKPITTEVVSLRNEYSTTYAEPDGLLKTTIANWPVNCPGQLRQLATDYRIFCSDSQWGLA